tara:strand:+ start:61083 stop:61232 length:150 start_codon:yes stop_codon:yes gene_type:complete
MMPSIDGSGVKLVAIQTGVFSIHLFGSDSSLPVKGEQRIREEVVGCSSR